MILNAIILAFRQISRNYLRAFLTMLGIIIGVSSVVIMIALGNGTTQKVKEQIASLGSNLITIFPARGFNTGGGSVSKKFTMQEVSILETRLTQAKIIAPIASSSITVQYSGANTQTNVSGVTNGYFEASNWEVETGRIFKDDEKSSNVCIIGQSVQKAIFKQENPLGQKVRVGKSICEVIGTLKSKGQGGGGSDQDDVLLLPFKTYIRDVAGNTGGITNINRIMVSLKDGVDSKVAVSEIKDVLRDYRHIKPGQIDTFDVMDTKDIQDKIITTTQILTIFLSAIAGVSLMVGGIGIMNIMLVSVTERTREIGTRLAIGALESDVLMQFLIESAIISAIGGVIGIVLAFFIALVATHYMDIPFVFDLWIALGAFAFSAFVGVVFGYLPARRASRLNPIEALRYE